MNAKAAAIKTAPKKIPTKKATSQKAASKGAAGKGFELRLSGSGGQGLQLSAKILARALSETGKFVAQSQSYEPTSRGGLSRSDLVVGSAEPEYPLATALDYMLLLDQVAVSAAAGMMRGGGLVITDKRLVEKPPKGDFEVLSLPITDTAIALGNARVANIVAVGVLVARAGLCAVPAMEATIRAMVPPKFAELNVVAFRAGLSLAEA